MAILPSKARPTWAGVLVRESGGERLVPWIEALERATVLVDGKRRRIEFQSMRDRTLADAYRRRAIVNELRAGRTVTFNAVRISPAAERLGLWFLLAIFALGGSLGVGAGVLALRGDVIHAFRDGPALIAVLTWLGCGFMTIGPIAVSVLMIRHALGRHRTALRRVELTGDKLGLTRRDGTIVLRGSDIASVGKSVTGTTLMTRAGERIAIGEIPTPISTAWVAMNAPRELARHDAEDSRGLRRGAVLMFLGLIACVVAAWTVDRLYGEFEGAERPSVLQALVLVPVFPALFWWLSKQRRIKPRAAPADGTR